MPPDAAGLDWKPWREIDWTRAGARVAIGDGVWPSLVVPGAGNAQAGPTGDPWIDSNGWLARYARARAPRAGIWIRAAVPEQPDSLEDNAFLLALADAAAHGAVWPVWIPEGPASAARRRRVEQAAAWFSTHPEWAAWPAQAALNIVASFAGPNTDFAAEVLNLAARRGLAFHVNAAWTGHRAVLWLEDAAPPEAAAFVSRGGLLICPAQAAAGLNAAPSAGDVHPRYRVSILGRGRVAVPLAAWDDPWQLAADAHLLLSRRFDAVRLFNAGSVLAYVTRHSRERRGVVQLLNFTLRPGVSPVVMQVAEPVRRARLWPLGALQPVPLAPVRNEFHLPPFPVYAAVELEYA